MQTKQTSRRIILGAIREEEKNICAIQCTEVYLETESLRNSDKHRKMYLITQKAFSPALKIMIARWIKLALTAAAQFTKHIAQGGVLLAQSL